MQKVVVLLVALVAATLVAAQQDEVRRLNKDRRELPRGSANLFQAHAILADARKKGGKGSGGKGSGGKGGRSGDKGGTRGKSERSGKGSNSDKGRMFFDDDDFINNTKSKKGSNDKGRGADDDDDSTPVDGSAPDAPQPSSAPQRQPVAATTPSPNVRTTQIPVVTATNSPVLGTLSPVIQSPASQRCSPTVGPCIDTFDSMVTTVANLASGNTVAICDGSTIRTSSAVTIAADETTLCCAGTNCVVASGDNTDRNLLVTGATFTVTDVIFEGGSSDVSGGNVAIFGSGNHHILDSRFQGGNSRLRGGNLFISTEGNVLVDGSTFADGTAAIGGGGLAIESSVGVEILSSQFVGNDAPEGGGFFSTRASPTLAGQMIMIEDSSFVLNTGEVGGGFLVSNLGELPSLTVLNTDFTENSVDTVGAAAAVVEFLTNLSLKYSSNTGSDNVATQFCNGILTAPDATAPACLAVTDEFP